MNTLVTFPRWAPANSPRHDAAPPPCSYDPAFWDIDREGGRGVFADLQHAKVLCATKCPLFAVCNAELNDASKKPRSQVMAARAFDQSGHELRTDRALLNHLSRLAGQRAKGLDDLDLLAVVPDLVTPPASSVLSEEQETLRALSAEVETASGVQFTLALGA